MGKPIKTQLNMVYIIRSQLFKVRLGKLHVIFALFVTEYYTEKILSSYKNKCRTLSKNYLLSFIPMIPFHLGMTNHLLSN